MAKIKLKALSNRVQRSVIYANRITDKRSADYKIEITAVRKHYRRYKKAGGKRSWSSFNIK